MGGAPLWGGAPDAGGPPPIAFTVNANIPMLKTNAAMQWPSATRRICAPDMVTSEGWKVMPRVKLK